MSGRKNAGQSTLGQPQELPLRVKGKLSAAAMPVEIGLSLPCMAEIRKWIGGEVVAEDGRLIWRPDDVDDFPEAD